MIYQRTMKVLYEYLKLVPAITSGFYANLKKTNIQIVSLNGGLDAFDLFSGTVPRTMQYFLL